MYHHFRRSFIFRGIKTDQNPRQFLCQRKQGKMLCPPRLTKTPQNIIQSIKTRISLWSDELLRFYGVPQQFTPPPPPPTKSSLQVPGIRDWSKSIGWGGPEKRGGGPSIFEPLVRDGSCNFQLTMGDVSWLVNSWE